MLKKFVNNPAHIVEEMISGFVGAFPDFYEKHPTVNAVLYQKRRKNKVALITGGGSGHEPLFVGFVGKGLADAAVCGYVYNAPDPETIYETVKSVETGKGALLLYGTYPGDKMNFDIAEERLNREGVVTRHICVHDDVISAPAEKKEERRGLAGDVFLLRVVGAACDAGLSIDEIQRLAEIANNRTWSIDVAITTRWSDSLRSSLESPEDRVEHIEYGIGLHGERGILRTRLQPVDQLVDKMYSQLVDETGLKKGDEVCVLVNGLGAASLLELAIVFHRMKELLEQSGIHIYDADFNSYCASYTSNGFSITILQMDEQIKPYYEAACYSPFYSHEVTKRSTVKRGAEPAPVRVPAREILPVEYIPAKKAGNLYEITAMQLRDMMIHVADRLIAAEAYLSRLDSIVGDGDHGVCMAMGMRKAVERLMNITEEYLPGEICQIIGKTMLLVGGASGVFFGSMFLAAAESLKDKRCVKVCDFAGMWHMAQVAVEKKGGARRGEKTLIDALAPAVDALKEHAGCDYLTALRAAEISAEEGMLETRKMVAKFGRGKFLADRALGCQDAGATTVWIMFQGMREYMDDAD